MVRDVTLHGPGDLSVLKLEYREVADPCASAEGLSGARFWWVCRACGRGRGTFRSVNKRPIEPGGEVGHARRAYPPEVIPYSMDGLSALNREPFDKDVGVFPDELRMLG